MASSGLAWRVIIVDNASEDRSADAIAEYAEKVTIIHNEHNVGFAAACNQGAKKSVADYLLFLNPDTRLIDLSLDAALAFLEDKENQWVGVLGPKLVDDDGHTQRSCARLPTVGRLVAQGAGVDRILTDHFLSCAMSDWDHMDTREVDQVMGACLIVRRTIFESLGGFDERFFVYYDDVDLCARVKKLGYKIVHFAESRVYHFGGGTTSSVKGMRLFYLLRSRLLYAGKYFGPVSVWMLVFTCLVLEPAVRMVWTIARLSFRDFAEVLWATALLWVNLPRYLPKVVCP